jgi:hypothetical protein
MEIALSILIVIGILPAEYPPTEEPFLLAARIAVSCALPSDAAESRKQERIAPSMVHQSAVS